MKIPTRPSKIYQFFKEHKQDKRVQRVIIQSFRWSLALARSNILLYFLQRKEVYKNNKNLIKMVMKQTMTKPKEKVNFL